MFPALVQGLTGSHGCPTCSMTRLGGSETSSMGKPYVAPYSAAASQSTSFPPQMQPSSVLSSGELQAAYAPQVHFTSFRVIKKSQTQLLAWHNCCFDKSIIDIFTSAEARQ